MEETIWIQVMLPKAGSNLTLPYVTALIKILSQPRTSINNGEKDLRP